MSVAWKSTRREANTFYQAPFFRVTKLLLWSQKTKQFGIEIINAIVYHCFIGKNRLACSFSFFEETPPLPQNKVSSWAWVSLKPLEISVNSKAVYFRINYFRAVCI